MPLLHLLLSCFAGVLLCQPLMFLILLPLQFPGGPAPASQTFIAAAAGIYDSSIAIRVT
jgi:hypothetical protein